MRATMYGWLIVWPAADRQRVVLVGLVADGRRDERLARDGAHRREDARVADVAAAELVGDHPRPGVARAGPGLVHRPAASARRWTRRRGLGLGAAEGAALGSALGSALGAADGAALASTETVPTEGSTSAPTVARADGCDRRCDRHDRGSPSAWAS